MVLDWEDVGFCGEGDRGIKFGRFESKRASQANPQDLADWSPNLLWVYSFALLKSVFQRGWGDDITHICFPVMPMKFFCL
jgi:hypothetical protein